MGRQATIALYVLALVAVVVAVDVLFFRHHFWERLVANVGIVLVFGAFYFRFLKHPLAQPRRQQPGGRPSVKIAVIGTGHIGGTLGQRWHAAGHEVAYGSRGGSGTGPGGAPVLPVGEAITSAEVVLLAVPGSAVAAAVAAHGAALAGKVVIDAVNRIGEPVVNSHAAIAAAVPQCGYVR